MHNPRNPHEKQQSPFITSSHSTLSFMDNPSKRRETLMGSSTTPSSTIDGVLDIALHHAKNIHNICIYGEQDVYAKFSVTHTQDAVYSTQRVRAGGRNPVFNQSLQIMISKMDAVLKCEIWMMSCVRTYLQDQLLGFVLIPLCDLLGKGRVTKDYSLSSTELFHTPSGTVCLSLTFYLHGADMALFTVLSNASPVRAQNGLHNVEEMGTHVARGNEPADEIIAENTHDDMLVNADQGMAPMEYNSIEFPDLQEACEKRHLVSAYLKMASGTDANMDEGACGKADQCDQIRMHVNDGDLAGAPFLQLGSSLMTEYDSEMGEYKGEDAKPHDGLLSPSCNAVLQEDVDTVTLRDTPSSRKAKEVQDLDSATIPVEASTDSLNSQAISSPMRTMLKGGPSFPVIVSSSNGQESQSSFRAPPATISLEPDEPVMQQQIVDMYMKSMQQFSESLAKMKLPLDLENEHSQQVEASNEPRAKKEEPTSKDGHRHFYGSRAFF